MIWNQLQEQLIKTLFHEVHTSNKETIKFFVHGGKGAGKSVAMLWAINFICERTPGISCLVVRRTFQGLKTDTMNILKRQPYPGILTGVKGKWKNGMEEFHYDNGSIIYFKHLENNEELTHGPSMGLIYIEQIELCAKDDYEMLKLRLRQYGKNNDYHSRYKELVKDHTLLPAKNYLLLNANPRGGWVMQDIIKGNNPTEFVQLSMPTNVNILNLPEDYINPYASDSYKRRHYDGMWEGLKGLIYPEFQSYNQIDSKFIDLIQINKQNNYIVVDPGYVTSKFAILFACVLSNDVKYNNILYNKGTVFIYDEISFNGKDVDNADKQNISQIAQKIKQRIKDYKLNDDYLGVIDPASNRQSTLGPSETQQLIAAAGLHFKNARKTHEQASIDNINSLLRQKRIIVSMTCLNFLQEIESYSYKLNNAGDIDTKEQPENKNNDFMDCFRYLMNELPFNLISKSENLVGYQINTPVNKRLEQWSDNLFKEDKTVSKDPTRQPYIKGVSYGIHSM